MDADVIIVGLGPGGASAAHYLASSGIHAIALDKATFPREKVCGDGLTPRAVYELAKMGIGTKETDGWIRNDGLRVIGGGHRLEMPWPVIASYPNYGLVRRRRDFDKLLVDTARKSGADIREGTAVTGPIRHERTGRVIGVTVREVDEKGRRTGEEQQLRAPIVIAADGASSRMAVSVGIQRRENRPLGVAARAYFKSSRHNDPLMESHLELWDGKPGESNLLPGYGWIFAEGDGTVNVGVGMLNSSAAFGTISYRDLLMSWIDGTPDEWGLREGNMTEPIASGPLAMGFNRIPHYAHGLLLVGDAGGMGNPFNGEGISYAMQSGRIAADIIVSALTRPDARGREKALRSYPIAMRNALGGYFSLGRVFVKLIGHPEVMKVCTRYGLPRPTLMRFVHKLLADLYDTSNGDTMDRVLTALTKIAPTT